MIHRLCLLAVHQRLLGMRLAGQPLCSLQPRAAPSAKSASTQRGEPPIEDIPALTTSQQTGSTGSGVHGEPREERVFLSPAVARRASLSLMHLFSDLGRRNARREPRPPACLQRQPLSASLSWRRMNRSLTPRCCQRVWVGEAGGEGEEGGGGGAMLIFPLSPALPP